MLRFFAASLDILYSTITVNRRLLFQSTNLCKKYKYALDPKKQINSGGGATLNRHRKDASIVDGKALTYFKFDTTGDECEFSAVESPKQRAYAEIIEAAVENLLTSKEAPEDIQECVIEIVHIEVAPCLASADVVWRIPDYCKSKYTKEETALLLENHLAELRLLLPAYSTVTQTPTVHFIYDEFTEKQNEMDALFEIVKKEEEEFMKRIEPS